MVFSVAMALVSLSFAAEKELPLVSKGKAEAIIVVPEKAQQTVIPHTDSILWSGFAAKESVEMDAAKLLAGHILQITGANIPIVTGTRLKAEKGRIISSLPMKTYILIGESDITKSLGVSCDGLKPGGILAVTTGNSLILAGPKSTIDPDGTFRAAVAFLESLGCRYLWPGELGKVLPKTNTLSIAPMNIRFSPPIPQRELRWWAKHPSERSILEPGYKALGIDGDQWKQWQAKAIQTQVESDWRAWNGLSGTLHLKGGHSGAGITLAKEWKEALDAHPEWFALQSDGTRAYLQRFRLCKSNLALIDFVAKGIIEYVKERPGITDINVSPNDGGYSSFCMCEECKKLDPLNAPKVKILIFKKQGESPRTTIDYPSLTDRMIWYYNHIAEKVTKIYPNLLFVVDAYSVYRTAPVREKPHPNLVFRYVGYDKEAWNAWRASGAKNIYWRPNLFWEGATLGQIHLSTDRITDWLLFAAQNGSVATDFDSILDHWALQGLNYYVAARANWNPNLGRDAIVKDYCQTGFGAGASYIEEFFRISEDTTIENNWNEEKIAKLRTLLDSAEKAVTKGEKEFQRIAFLRIGLNFHHVHTLLKAMAADATAKKAFDRNLATQLLTLNYCMMRDIAKNHHLAVNTPMLMWRTANLAYYQKIGGRGFQASPEILKAVEKKSMTGNEKSIKALLDLYGLDVSGLGASHSNNAKSSETRMDADEEGRPIEVAN